ncbi:MAG: hypothetical protein JXA57_09830 [Armatimonadetes bacterium]|nr:hypothetical protein [Armatimonadota bacterium]
MKALEIARPKSRAVRVLGALALVLILAALTTGVALGASPTTSVLFGQEHLVPPGQVLHVVHEDGAGNVLKEQWVDTLAHRIRVEKPVNDVVKTVEIFDETGHTTLGGVTLQVNDVRGEAGYAVALASTDPLLGLEVTRIGVVSDGGGQTTVWTADLPKTEEDIQYTLTSYEDDETGLRTRDEISRNGVLVSVVRRELLACEKMDKNLDQGGLAEEASLEKAARQATLTHLSYPVLGLPNELKGLRLASVIPGPGWQTTRLEYASSQETSPGAVVIVTTFNLESPAYAAYPTELLAPLDSAVKETDEVGEILWFGQAGTGIQLQLARGSVDCTLDELAAALTKINDAKVLAPNE